ncbi:alkaline phosphatase family protein [Streptomyces canus]|uniref:alkaline phosphatase family protein n=1 Tax=Streptomyces canus TaxID=58343 RepID=UPI002E2C6F54|nr:alkaline phosphatase family protein [Streptomyces canus]
MTTDRSHAMDHVVVAVFENRSLDNVLGHLYGPEDGKNFEGVIGKNLSNPIPDWAEDGADRKVVPYTVATDMNSPNPDSGQEYPHTNTQLFNVSDEANHFKIQDAIGPPYNAPAPGQTPTMDGFVTDYISNFTGEMGRQPTYEEYAQIMTGFTPEQVPVLNGLARGFGVFDHWFCEVPSQTLPNRSFWTSATSSGYVWNPPTTKFIKNNNAETIFNRLEKQFATHVVPFSQFETDAANGDLPDFSFIEPNVVIGHNDYHPAVGRSFDPDVTLPGADPPSSILGGEEFLSRIYAAYRGMQGTTGSTVWNMTLLIGWDEPGGTYDHVPPPAVPSPDKASSPGEFGFAFDRSGYRVPAVVVSPWIAEGEVLNEEYRHTSLIATLREQWDLGDPFTARDAAARTFSSVFTLDTPRDPDTWPVPKARPVPPMQQETAALGAVLSTLGKTMIDGIRHYAAEHNLEIEGIPKDPKADIPDDQVVTVIRGFLANWFPLLASK